MKDLKTLILVILSLCLLPVAVKAQPKVDYQAEWNKFIARLGEFSQMYRLPGANTDSLDRAQLQYIESTASAHLGDSLGLAITQIMAANMTRAQLDSVMNLSPMYKNDERIRKYYYAQLQAEATGVGSKYREVTGIDATTGQTSKLSDYVALGRPVVVDFWASWCGPCRREISNYLAPYYAKYKDQVTFVGIAVWENALTDTQGAMKQLPISWPVIFAGGRDNSPASYYGIVGIPHIMLIGTDGIIQGRDLRGENIEQAILKSLGQ